MTAATEVVSAFLAALRSADLDAACALLTEDAVVDEAASLPFGGMRKGPDGFRSLVADLGSSFKLRLGDQHVHDAGAFVVVTFEAQLESRRNGRSATMAVVDLYTVEDGRIARLDVFYKDTHAVVEVHGADDAPDEGRGSHEA